MRRQDGRVDGGCPEFERHLAAAGTPDPAREAAWADHLLCCGSCQEQDAADRALRRFFAGAGRPELPPFFAQRCALWARISRRR